MDRPKETQGTADARLVSTHTKFFYAGLQKDGKRRVDVAVRLPRITFIGAPRWCLSPASSITARHSTLSMVLTVIAAQGAVSSRKMQIDRNVLVLDYGCCVSPRTV